MSSSRVLVGSPATAGSGSPAGRGPVAPRFAIPLIDRALSARPARVLDVRAETPTIVTLRLGRPDSFHHRAGQHAVLRVDTDRGPDLRPLSIASAPGSDVVEFATRVGPSAFKRAVVSLLPGDTVKVSRALGRLRLDPERPVMFVSGGIGITPVRSMLTDAAHTHRTAPVRLLFSNSTAEEIPFRADLERLATQLPDLRITWLLTRSVTDAPAGDVVPGRVTSTLLERHLKELPDALVYVTGPAAMVGDITMMLAYLGVPRSRVRAVRQTMPGT
jgi:ferredoxin-NADP reductase